ncbi:hypothetical protein FUAX_04950 [Fulvitalea axinellae]|uniref:Uncharacterized protein n=1 Tax=Fulvitalea axinellae TaxID=1182444 RepID=A0AAU9CWU8_9BACT|nr:hypothetical protein FUAX_04950 [Fulvitalea axinellae]
MGHHLTALIGKDTISRSKLKEYGLAVAFEKGYAIVILDDEAMDRLDDLLDKDTEALGENIEWDCELTLFLAKEIGLGVFALIKTDYFAGLGEQHACVYDGGDKKLDNVCINTVLRELGVECEGEQDEFDSINLSEYRQSEIYYWNPGNWADKKENMIGGRVLDSL